MAQDDFDRVQTDLAAMKAVCIEQVVPSEEIGPSAIAGGCGILLAITSYTLPLGWTKAAAVLLAAAGAAVYLPWKRRVFRNDYPRRRLEAKEGWAVGVAWVGFVAYAVWFRLALDPPQQSLSRMFGGAFCLLGSALVAYAVAQPRRRFHLGPGIALVVGGVLAHFASSNAEFAAIGFGMMAAVCLSNAICLWWAARRQRSEHGGN